MRDEGVIKFKCAWIKRKPIYPYRIRELIERRNALHGQRLIGVYPDGIGFGNISARLDYAGLFVVSGSQTGHVARADENHFTMVTAYDIAGNSLTCEGPLQASSESLTHAMIYQEFPAARAVIHVHHASLWKKRMGLSPTTRKEVPYGTPEMAGEVARLARHSKLGQERALVMAGHEEGVIIFGRDLDAAYERLTKELLSIEGQGPCN